MVLSGYGASGPVVEELLAYNANEFDAELLENPPKLPLGNEDHLKTWRTYAEEAAGQGVVEALSHRLVQLRFPIEEGVSGTDRYRGVTLRGELPPQEGGPDFTGERISLLLNETQAGAIPVLEIESRADFETLVRALSHRNEPRPVPDSMGACIISGLNNWDRIREHRRKFEASGAQGSWDAEFKGMIPDKGKYQDRLILLSSGPYSAVPASAMGLSEPEWLEKSMIIRREHECAHYFTLRVLGKMRNNLIDELIADYVGLVAAFGEYRGEHARLFLGLDAHPRVQPGGRVENYRGDPALGDEAFDVVKRLMLDAIAQLEAFNAAAPERFREPEAVAKTILALAARTLEELARPEAQAELLEAV
ncbi:MAG: hypothetical protein AAGA81_06985 [Acidobacteriota bacterium]